MHHVIVHELRADHQIAYQLRIGGNGDFQGVFDRTYRGDAVDQGTHAADTLSESPGVARVAAP
jgi:hypothetical protein